MVHDGTLQDGFPSAFLWRNGSMTDLNTYLTPDSSFEHLLVAFAINDAEMIVGFGLTGAGEVHGFLAIPRGEGRENFVARERHVTKSVELPEYVRKSLSGPVRRCRTIKITLSRGWISTCCPPRHG